MSETVSPTTRLYYTDAYRADFSARVVHASDDGRRVYLDATAFYPTSGGQLHDIGTLGGVDVVDVIDEESRIAHVLERAVTGTEVAGKIDWRRRFDHMQQHTGQHLLSAVFEDLFGMKTASVHFGDEYSTLDLETDSLSGERLVKAERRANEIIADNRAVTVTFEDAATAKGLRKQVDREGELRIVSIDRLDRSACGGTHVRATGEIGCVTLRGTERIRKTMRVQFLCGLRAVARARTDYEALTTIASALSTSIDDTPALVEAQASQLKDSEQSRRKLERELAAHRARQIFDAVAPDAVGRRVAVIEGAAPTMEQVRMLGQSATELRAVILAATTAEGNCLLVAASEDSGVDAGKLVRDALASVGGKGGGSPRLAQGTAPSPEHLRTALTVIRAALGPGR